MFEALRIAAGLVSRHVANMLTIINSPVQDLENLLPIWPPSAEK